MDTSTSMMLFTGNANHALAEDVAHRLGVPLGKALVGTFSDGEVQIEIEENVRRQEVFVLQSTGAPSAVNLFELLALTDALKRASATSVTAVIPYFGYARQDRRPRSARVPITAKLAVIDKRRPKANVATVMNIIGDVNGKSCVLVDDIVDTAGTLCAAAAALKERGAREVSAYCVHPVLSGAAIGNIERSQLDKLVVTDTLPLSAAARACPKIRQLSVAELLAETIRRIAFGESVSSLYVD